MKEPVSSGNLAASAPSARLFIFVPWVDLVDVIASCHASRNRPNKQAIYGKSSTGDPI